MDTNPYLKLTDLRKFWYEIEKGNFSFHGSSFQYFMVSYGTQLDTNPYLNLTGVHKFLE